MNKLKDKINKVIQSNILNKEMIDMPSRGLLENEIKEIEDKTGKKIFYQYRSFLKRYNGYNLDWIKFHGCTKIDKEIFDITENFDETIEEIIIASDSYGIGYFEKKNGEIFSFDYDGGAIEKVADSFEDFICNYVFGKRSREFGGDEWYEDLKKAGIFND
jgi:hypothetical protein